MGEGTLVAFGDVFERVFHVDGGWSCRAVKMNLESRPHSMSKVWG